jgi:pimeloyl-ACP methyl ester carboxylesterase
MQESAQVTEETAIAYINAMKLRKDRLEAMLETTAPVLYIVGRHDTVIPYEDQLSEVVQYPEVEVHIMRLSAHMSIYEQPKYCRKVISQFVENFEL